MSLQPDSDLGGSTLAELKAALDQLTRERDEALGQQAATAEVLKVISRSAVDLPAVLDTLLASASILAEADIGTIRYQDGAAFRLAATYGCAPEWREHFARYSMKPDRGSVFGQTILKGGTVHIPDVLADPDYARPDAQKLMNLRAALGVPLIRDGKVFGVVNLFRRSPRPFTAKQIALVETFADQAVIAIENERLFEAEQRRSAELAESLSQQTATADVLKVISRETFDLQAVLNTLVESAARLCEAYDSLIFLRHDDRLRIQAHHGPIGADFSNYVIGRGWVTGRAFVDQLPIHVHDLTASADFPDGREMAIRNGHRTIFAVPLLRQKESIGVLTIRRFEVKPFTEKQIELVKTFADQAVIAIENVRLFEAEQQRTNELRESLAHQTATSDILASISGSMTDTKPVFDAIVRNLRRLFGTSFSVGVTVVARSNDRYAGRGRGRRIRKSDGNLSAAARRRDGGRPGNAHKTVTQYSPVVDNSAPFTRGPADRARHRIQFDHRRADDSRGQRRRRHCLSPIASSGFSMRRGRADQGVRRPGGDRDRERAAVRRRAKA